MSDNLDKVSQKCLRNKEGTAKEQAEEEELDDPMKWSKKIQDKSLIYSKFEIEHNCFGNCMSCHKVGVTDFFCLCQEEVHFVHHTFKEALNLPGKS
jgi:hypothetical protein